MSGDARKRSALSGYIREGINAATTAAIEREGVNYKRRTYQDWAQALGLQVGTFRSHLMGEKLPTEDETIESYARVFGVGVYFALELIPAELANDQVFMDAFAQLLLLSKEGRASALKHMRRLHQRKPTEEEDPEMVPA